MKAQKNCLVCGKSPSTEIDEDTGISVACITDGCPVSEVDERSEGEWSKLMTINPAFALDSINNETIIEYLVIQGYTVEKMGEVE